MISYAGGARMLQLMGAVSLSFYDWYCDLPPASPETWGEQTDVNESADWFNAKLLAVVGSNLNMTRTPDCHFAAEARYNGTKMWVFLARLQSSLEIRRRVGWPQRGPGRRLVDGGEPTSSSRNLITTRRLPYFLDYLRKFTDAPYLVVLDEPEQGALRPGRLLRANRLEKYAGIENGDWQFLMWDETAQAPRMPMGSVGFRWAKEKGKWNLRLKDGLDGSDIRPVLTFLDDNDGVAQVALDDFGEGRVIERGVPFKRIETADGSIVRVTTSYDLLMAQYGVGRGLEGDYPADYNDENAPLHPGLVGKVHRHGAGHADPFRARVGAHG